MMLNIDVEKQTLAKAEQHIIDGNRRVERQRELLREIRRDGDDTADAIRVLRILEKSQQAMREHRDLIVENIERMSKP
jgi:hypothetical protein